LLVGRAARPVKRPRQCAVSDQGRAGRRGAGADSTSTSLVGGFCSLRRFTWRASLREGRDKGVSPDCGAVSDRVARVWERKLATSVAKGGGICPLAVWPRSGHGRGVPHPPADAGARETGPAWVILENPAWPRFHDESRAANYVDPENGCRVSPSRDSRRHVSRCVGNAITLALTGNARFCQNHGSAPLGKLCELRVSPQVI